VIIESISKNNWFTDYTVQWRPIMMCNYDCSYCSPTSHLAIEKRSIPTASDLIKAAKNLRNAIPKDKETMVVITGGEPFLIKDIHLWLEYLLDNNFYIMIFTNSSLNEETYKKCKKVFSNKKLLFKMSFHPEFADIDKFATLANNIQKLGAKVEIRAMLANKMFDKIDELESKTNVDFIRLPVFPLYNKKENKVNPINSSSRNLKDYYQTADDGKLNYFTKDELQKLKQYEDVDPPDYLKIKINDNIDYSADKIVLQGKNIFKGWKCSVVQRKLVIKPNGDLHYGICNNEGVFGNIYDENLDLFSEKFTTCNAPLCGVIEEVMLEKYKDV